MTLAQQIAACEAALAQLGNDPIVVAVRGMLAVARSSDVLAGELQCNEGHEWQAGEYLRAHAVAMLQPLYDALVATDAITEAKE